MLKATKLIAIAVALTFSGAAAEERVPSAGERWESALLDAKEQGKLPGRGRSAPGRSALARPGGGMIFLFRIWYARRLHE